MTTPQTPAAPDVADDGVPVFGKPKTTGPKYDTFRLWIEPDGAEGYEEAFEAHTAADAGAIMELLSARNQLQQGTAMARLLGGILRNDDGVPADWQPTRNEQGLVMPEMDDDGYLIKDEQGDPLYRDAYGDLVTDVTLLEVPHEAGSSRRRFSQIMDSPTKRVTFEALSEIAQWVVTRSGSRPTRRQQNSPRGGAQTKRSPRAKRSSPPA